MSNAKVRLTRMIRNLPDGMSEDVLILLGERSGAVVHEEADVEETLQRIIGAVRGDRALAQHVAVLLQRKCNAERRAMEFDAGPE